MKYRVLGNLQFYNAAVPDFRWGAPHMKPTPLRPSVSGSEGGVGLDAWFHTTRFLTTCATLDQLPDLDVPEVAFVGRSNAGKSTCLNTLAQQRQLAFASKRPGRTQHINLFVLGKHGQTDAVLTDLPGYGYAAVGRDDKRRWQQVMANYLVSRHALTGIVCLVDSRLGLTELDQILLELVAPRVAEGLKFLILLTKADKLSKAERSKALSIAKLHAAGGDAALFSALSHEGVAQLRGRLANWCGFSTSTDDSLGSQG